MECSRNSLSVGLSSSKAISSKFPTYLIVDKSSDEYDDGKEADFEDLELESGGGEPGIGELAWSE